MENQKKPNLPLQKNSEIAKPGNHSNSLLQEFKGADVRLQNLPISSIIREKGIEAVEAVINASILKCSESLQIKLSDSQIETLSEDLIDVYKWDAIEDITLALKRGRQGAFGANYKQLNMIIIREWMKQVLEEKCELREKSKLAVKKADKEPLPKVDYQAYLDNEKKKKEAPKKESLSEMQYQAKKHDYFNNK